MNFIEAWKKANGKEIIIKDEKEVKEHIKTDGNIKISINTPALSTESLLSENWEVAKKTKVVWTMTVLDYNGAICAYVFDNRESMEKFTKKWKNVINEALMK